jgi:hypothetical protein
MSNTRNDLDDPLPEYAPFPLYHGTSTLWEQSIQTHGLGGRRITEELRALEFHQRALACLKTIPIDWPVGTVLTMERIVAQSVTNGNFNLRHGGLYLTPSRTTATNYAVHNPFGSELLTYCHLLYEAILNSTERPLPDWFEQYSELLAIVKQPGRPLLIRVNHVRTEELVEESGQPALAGLRWLLDLIADSKVETTREKERVESLRKAIKKGDMEMVAELFVRPKKYPLTEDHILETLDSK